MNSPTPSSAKGLTAAATVDAFLSGGGAGAAADPDSTETHFSLAVMDVAQAQEAVFLVPAEEVAGRFTLASDVLAAFRGELQAFFRYLKDRGQLLTELLSATARDQAVRQLASNMLDEAYKAPSRAWMTSLPTGRQVVIAPSELVAAMGFERICQVAHERAIRSAQTAGRPFNAQALAHYQSVKPMETA